MESIQYGIQQGFNPMTAAAYGSQPYGSPYGHQGFAGAGNPLSGLLGSGIAGLLSAQNIGRQPGQVTDGLGGIFPSYGNPYGSVDPMTAAHIQQLVQQAQLAQQAQVAQQLAQQQLGRVSPFGVDPMSAAIAQQRGLPGQQMAPWLGMNAMNRIDPVTAAYIQQQQIAQLCQQLALQSQLAQQGQFGHQHGQFGQGQFGQGQLSQGHLGQAWLGGGQNLWANPQPGTAFGRGIGYQSPIQNVPFQYAGGGYGSQLPIY